jgi:predicted dehydrogenase
MASQIRSGGRNHVRWRGIEIASALLSAAGLTPMKTIRFGLSGAGYMGRTHAEAVQHLAPAAAMVAVWGGTRAPALAKRLGIELERSMESLARRGDIDAIIVASPNRMHYGDTLTALEAGKHVLLEYPMAMTTDECDRLLEAASRRRLVIGIGYTLRFRANPMKAYELIKAGAIGKIRTMHYSYYEDLTTALNVIESKTGMVEIPKSGGYVYSACHAIDLMRWFTRAEIRSVAAFCRVFLPGHSSDDADVAIMELTNGAICSLHLSSVLVGPYPREMARLSILGSEGSIDLDAFGEMHLSDRRNGWRLVSTQPYLGVNDPELAYRPPRMLAYYGQIQSLLDGIDGKPMSGGQGIDGRKGLEVCAAMLTSTVENRVIRLC